MKALLVAAIAAIAVCGIVVWEEQQPADYGAAPYACQQGWEPPNQEERREFSATGEDESLRSKAAHLFHK